MSALRITALTLVVICVCILSFIQEKTAAVTQQQPTTVFTRFFGTTPIPDQYLQMSPSAWRIAVSSTTLPWLSLLPTWHQINKTMNPTNKEVLPFIDEISAVRILGGWDAQFGKCNQSCDIIDENMNFRWNLLDQRVDHWVNSTENGGAGKNILIVLDNIPYVLCNDTCKLGPFGQDSPPVNYGVFHWFIKEIVLHFQNRYGKDVVATKFRFRVGTEPDGPRYGNATQYFHSYFAAAQAIKELSPQSPVGAGNWLHHGAGLHRNKDYYPSNQAFEYEFYQNCRRENVSVDFIAQSDYVEGDDTPGGRRFPSFIQDGGDAMSQYISWYNGETPSTSTIPREIHEFSPLFNRAKRTSVEPGSFGVSFYVAMWSTALSNGITKVFHWGTANTRGGPFRSSNLWTGLGTAMAWADVLVGRQILNISVPSNLQRGIYALESTSASLVTSFDPFRDANFTLSYVLPHDVAVAYMIDSSSSVFDSMLRQAMKLNFTNYYDGLPYLPKTLLNAKGLAWLQTPAVWQQFLAMQKATFSTKMVNKKKGETLDIPQFTTYLFLEKEL